MVNVLGLVPLAAFQVTLIGRLRVIPEGARIVALTAARICGISALRSEGAQAFRNAYGVALGFSIMAGGHHRRRPTSRITS